MSFPPALQLVRTLDMQVVFIQIGMTGFAGRLFDYFSFDPTRLS